jgi:hypothetical protein
VEALYEDHDGSLWIGTHSGGLDHFDGTNFMSYGPKQGLTGKYFTSILRTRDGALWVGSNGGGVFRLAHGQFTGYSIRDGLASSIVLVLHEDSEGYLWLGTQGDGGLSRWDGRRFVNITRSMGLAADAVKEILDDNDGNLWLGSNCGLIRASKDELNELAEGRITWVHAMSYGEKDGLPNVECRGGTQPAACKTRDGKLWFATHEGLVAVDPRRFKRSADNYRGSSGRRSAHQIAGSAWGGAARHQTPAQPAGVSDPLHGPEPGYTGKSAIQIPDRKPG